MGATLDGLPACPLAYYLPGLYKGYLSIPLSYWKGRIAGEDGPRA
jgi:hypothetical protein